LDRTCGTDVKPPRRAQGRLAQLRAAWKG
jgi:hypothetical protein